MFECIIMLSMVYVLSQDKLLNNNQNFHKFIIVIKSKISNIYHIPTKFYMS